MKFLFLCAGLAGYLQACIQRLSEIRTDASITVISHDNHEQKPFIFEECERIDYRRRDELTPELMQEFSDQPPDYLFMAGWFDKAYLKLGRVLRGKIPVVMAADRKWYGNFNQQMMVWGRANSIRRCCDYIWIPGLPQYEYARRMGFPVDRILTGLYSASNHLFEGDAISSHGRRRESSVVFIGNMWQDKGVNELVKSFDILHAEYPDWRLRLIGLGPLVDRYRDHSSYVVVEGFKQPHELPEILCSAGVFCLPSYRDAWGVVIHEAACAGLPIVATTACGANTALVHDSYNGFHCKPKDVESLVVALRKIFSLTTEERKIFGERSKALSQRYSPDLWCSKVLSVLK